MKNLVKKKLGESSWITWIKNRIRDNLNLMSITTGPTGSGKSFADLSIAYQIDPSFSVEKQVAFSFTDFMKIINGFNGDDPELKNKKYKVVVFDEVQCNVNKREWQSKVNKLFNYLISTFRHQNIIVLFNSPFSDFVDSATMKLIHTKFEVKGWSKKHQVTQVRGKIQQYNDRLGKFYEHSLFVIPPNGGKPQKFNGFWYIKKPPEHLITPYEQRKTEFTHRLNKQITKELQEMEGQEDDKKDDKNELTQKQEETINYLKQGYRIDEIVKETGKTEPVIRERINLAKKKGYKISPKKDETAKILYYEVTPP